MKTYNYLLLILLVACFAACTNKKLPNGFYINDAGDNYNASTFEVRGDTLLWKKNYTDTIAKVFIYTLSGDDLEGTCAALDERMKKKAVVVSDGIILDKQIFKAYDPYRKTLPEGEYKNFNGVKKFEMHLTVKGDSLILESFRYDEFLYRIASTYEILSPNLIRITTDGKDVEDNVFQFFPDGFVISEARYVPVTR